MKNIVEWKASLVGLLLASIIIATLVTRPSWGVHEIAQLASAVGVVLFGFVSRLGTPAEVVAAETKSGAK